MLHETWLLRLSLHVHQNSEERPGSVTWSSALKNTLTALQHAPSQKLRMAEIRNHRERWRGFRFSKSAHRLAYQQVLFELKSPDNIFEFCPTVHSYEVRTNTVRRLLSIVDSDNHA